VNPGEILRRGRTHQWEGRHEQALEDFTWFHKHALEYDRAYYGVRLSFAIGYWKELADVYPPAAAAMASVKSDTIAALMRGEGDRSLFADVVAINRELGCSSETYDLFTSLMAKDLERAKKYADLAMPCIVEAEDFELATKFLPHPEDYLLYYSERLNEDLERKGVPRKKALTRREAYVHNYCEDVRLLLRVLEGVGELEWRRAALDWAIALVRPQQARFMVATELTSSQRSQRK
jgi:hypothetical protein